MKNPDAPVLQHKKKNRLLPLLVYLLIVYLGFILSACSGDALFDNPEPAPKPEPKPTLPPVTTSGKGTFGCRVNDTIWLPKGNISLPGTTMYYFKSGFTIRGYNSTKDDYVSLALTPVTSTGYYDFKDLVGNSSSRVTYLPQHYTKIYEAQPATMGYLNILRFDTIKGIVSGTFAFDAYNQHGDTVHVTDGRFDLHF